MAFTTDYQTSNAAISIYLDTFSQEFIYTNQPYAPGINDLITVSAPAAFVNSNPSYVIVWDVRLFKGSYMHHRNSGNWYRTVIFDW